MNIIIAGCGKVGRALAEQLSREKHDITGDRSEAGSYSADHKYCRCAWS